MSLPFQYNVEHFGGTEYVARYFHKNILPYKNNFYNYQSFILPGPLPDFKTIIKDTRDIVLWMHNPFFQFDENLLFCVQDTRFLQKLKYIVVVSSWHKEIIKNEIKIDDNKIIIIPNGFDPILKNKNKFNKTNKIKIIYTSSPDRGLEILCRSLKYIDEDFELNIFSNIFPETLENDNLFKQTEKDKRVIFFGKTPRKTVRKYFSDSHIWAYPSVFLETFCISLTEAISAECLPIYPDIGALKETANNFGICYDYIEDSEVHAKEFAKILTDAIIQIKNKNFKPTNQATVIEKKYSWVNFEKNWENFYDLL
jgi:glycosyltransferase involved in cell wall biosynthesis